MSAPAGIVARWSSRRHAATCSECGEATPVAGVACAGCGQLTGEAVGMLATVIHTPAGPRLVIAQRTGRAWTPIRTLPATPANLRALARPHAHGPQPAAIAAPGVVPGRLL